MNIDETERKCKLLAYSKTPVLNKEIIEVTRKELGKLYAEYGFAQILGRLSKLWDYEKASQFFDQIDLGIKKKCQVKTIASFYKRAYNGGIERVNAQLINMWLEAGYRVVLITEENPNDLDYFYPKDKVKRIIVGSRKNIAERLCDLQKIFYDNHVDVFINNFSWMNQFLLWECVLAHYMNISYIVYAHGFFPIFYMSQYALSYQAFRMSDLIIAISETNARFYQMCGCRTCLIQNPVSEELKNIKQIAGLNNHRILWIGRISPEKRPLDAIFIFKEVLDFVPDAILDIIGSADSSLGEQMKVLCKELGISGAVRFHGLQHQDKMKDFYLNASLILFTSEGEGYPMTLLESKAYGLPIVMYSLPYLSLVRDGKGFLSADIGDIDTMAKNVFLLLRDESLRKTLGRASRESFAAFAEYDLLEKWKAIFNFCSEQTANDDIFYMPEQLQEADKYIFPHLFSVLQRMVKTAASDSLTKNFDYNLGHKIMKIPRGLIKIFKHIAARYKRS